MKNSQPETPGTAPAAYTAPPVRHGRPYGLNIGNLVQDYPDFIVLAGFEDFGWRARMIATGGMPGNGRGHVGRELSGLALDELADKMDEMRAGVIRLAPGETLPS
jgi:hypothetical protein